MGQIRYIGECLPTVEQFLDYMLSYKMSAWRPAYITMHHTGSPDLDVWHTFRTRTPKVDDKKWMGNLATYYGSPAYDKNGKQIKSAWSSGPHFFITPENFCVLSPPERPGVHAASFNGNSWGVECVGNFDVKKDVDRFTGDLKQRYVDGLAGLHIVLGIDPGGYARGRSGLHFHRDDPKTKKSCPGKGVTKADMVRSIKAAIARLRGGVEIKGEDQAMGDKAVPVKGAVSTAGRVINVADDDVLNIRAGAGAKNPLVGKLKPRATIEIVGEVRNGSTLWYEIDIAGDANGFVSAYYVEVDA